MTDKPVPCFTVEHSAQELLDYKDRLLNHISFNHIHTLSGFSAQRKLIPQILKYSFENNVGHFIDITVRVVNEKNLFPLIVKNAYYGEQYNTAQLVSHAVEEYLLVSVSVAAIKTLLKTVLSSNLYTLQDKLVMLGMFFMRLDHCDDKEDPYAMSKLVAEYQQVCVPENKIQVQVQTTEYNVVTSRLQLAAVCMDHMNNASLESNRKQKVVRLLQLPEFDISSGAMDRNTAVTLYHRMTAEHFLPFMSRTGNFLLQNFLLQYVETCFQLSRTGAPSDAYFLMILHYFWITMQILAEINFDEAGFKEQDITQLLGSYRDNMSANEAAIKEVFEVVKWNGFNNLDYIVHLL